MQNIIYFLTTLKYNEMRRKCIKKEEKKSTRNICLNFAQTYVHVRFLIFTLWRDALFLERIFLKANIKSRLKINRSARAYNATYTVKHFRNVRLRNVQSRESSAGICYKSSESSGASQTRIVVSFSTCPNVFPGEITKVNKEWASGARTQAQGQVSSRAQTARIAQVDVSATESKEVSRRG